LILLDYSVELLSVLLGLLVLLLVFAETSLVAGAAHRKGIVLRFVFFEIIAVAVFIVLIVIFFLLIGVLQRSVNLIGATAR